MLRRDEADSRARGYLNTGVWIIAAGVICYGLYMGREILAPFALAVFIWLVMEGLARAIKKPLPNLPGWLAHAAAILLVVLGCIVFIGVMRRGVVEFAQKSDVYETRINQLIQQTYERFGLHDAPQLSDMFMNGNGVRFVEPALTAIRGMATDLILILVYIAFLYLARAAWHKKLDAIFRDREARARANAMGDQVRHTMEQYMWVQTALSIITTALTWLTMQAMGLDNALFWAFVIFFLNYIPTIGSIVAPILPALFAIAQPEWPAWMPSDPMWSALFVFLGVTVWQFVIGNFVGPRMMGDSLNISALVVMLSLAVWGALWGLTGMFLSAPLTVLIMIVLSQIPGARWIAILLSAEGDPGDAGAGATHSDPVGVAPAAATGADGASPSPQAASPA